MGSLDKYMDEIENKEKDIAMAIALSFSNGDKNKADRRFEEIYNEIKEKSSVFILDAKRYTTIYEKKVDEIILKINEIVGYDTKPYFVKNKKINVDKKNHINNSINDFESLSDEEILACKKIFKKNNDVYEKLDINFESLVKIYIEQGKDKITQLNLFIKKANKAVKLYSFKRKVSLLYEHKKMPFINKKFSSFCEKYNINNMNDLLNLNTELDSFLVEEKDFNDEQKRIIEENRDLYRKRINESKEYFLDKKSVLKIKKELNSIFNFNLYNDIFVNTNFSDFFERNNIKINETNLIKAFNLYFHVIFCSGVCAKKKFGKRYFNYCVFNGELLNSSSKWQNEVIVHEFIHVLEGVGASYVKRISEYESFNEALTEYFTMEAMKYLDDNILSFSDDNNKNVSAYKNMVSMVEILKNSDIWIDILHSKLTNDAEYLQDRIGYLNFKNINRCFDKVYSQLRNNEIAVQCKKELQEIIKNMEIKKR